MLPDMCWWYINNNIRFHYKLFPRKTNMTKFFKKSQNPHFGPILGSFAQFWAKNEFSGKKGFCQFFNIQIIYHCAKNQKNLMSHFSENCWTDTAKTSLFHTANFSPVIDWKIPQSDWPRAFWAISQKSEFFQIWKLFKHKRITVIQTFIIDHTVKKIKN